MQVKIANGRLDGKVALITGAARGMGAAMAALFVAEGAKVVVTDVLDAQGREVAAGLPGASYERLDVGVEQEWARVVVATVARHGRLDILVNNAAIVDHAPVADTSLALYERITRINQTGTFLGMRAVIAPMKANGGGSIVNMSSRAGLGGIPGLCAYTASKYAVRGMTKVAALELAKEGIRVNSVHPSLTDTPMVQTGSREEQQQRAAATPFGRAARPEEIANLVLFLASDDASYCSGGEYTCDGAISAGWH